MKTLIINDKLAVIEDSVYFPFTYTASDLENINIINVPSSKTITIPRCNQNDEIFGSIGELTRFNIGFEDNMSGVKFNQIKKCTYILSSDSEVVSKGILAVTTVDAKYYSIVLYDELLDALEAYDEVYLTDITIEDNLKVIFDKRSNKSTYNYYKNHSSIRPVICVDEANTKATEIRCYTQASSGGALTYGTSNIPFESSNHQLRSMSTSQCRWAFNNTQLLESINEYNKGLQIDYSDTDINTLLTEVKLLSNKPNNKLTPEDIDTILAYQSGPLGQEGYYQAGRKYDIPLSVSPSYNNGKVYINVPITATYSGNVVGTTNQLVGYFIDGVYTAVNYGAPVGTYLGRKYAGISFISEVNGVEYESEILTYIVELYYGINCIFSPYGSGYTSASTVTLSYTLTVNSDDLYIAPYKKVRMYLRDRPESTIVNPSTDYSNFFNAANYLNNVVTPEFNILFKNDKFVDGNHINPKTVLPKVSIKTYLLTIAKYFNLNLSIKDNKIKISKKQYKITSEVPIIEDGANMVVTTIQNSRLLLNAIKPDFKELEKYNVKWEAQYAEQAINTGYTIKKSTKPVNYDTTIPIDLKDYNPFAYDVFLKYLNTGYQKTFSGIASGIDNKISFCYLNTVNDRMHIGDCYYPDIIENNSLVDKTYVSELLHRWEEVTTSYSQAWDSSYNTASAFKFSGSTIVASLDMNKPHENYAGIQDVNYPDTTTLYYKYHRNILIDKFDSNTHIINCKMYLDKNPISTIFSVYNIKGSYYIISELPEYDPTQPGMYEVKLMKVNDPNNYINPYN